MKQLSEKESITQSHDGEKHAIKVMHNLVAELEFTPEFARLNHIFRTQTLAVVGLLSANNVFRRSWSLCSKWKNQNRTCGWGDVK
jgi:hypothetical protein